MAVQSDRTDRLAHADREVPTPRRRLWVSRSPGRVVVRYVDGRVLKGYADFDPEQPCLRLVPVTAPEAEGIDIAVKDLKAVFFVRTFEGDPSHDESKDLYQPRPPETRKVSVRFRDGEELVGYTRQLDRHRAGLFFTPLDSRSNNLRVFAVFDALWGVRRLL
ncbi:MAG TPA: hypothetical protein VHF87_19010 [Methylomirabilota bacterium]|jgi:hypothetical protein|nr:hypothetical protein [Methylomirabilota bacterium]